MKAATSFFNAILKSLLLFFFLGCSFQLHAQTGCPLIGTPPSSGVNLFSNPFNAFGNDPCKQQQSSGRSYECTGIGTPFFYCPPVSPPSFEYSLKIQPKWQFNSCTDFSLTAPASAANAGSVNYGDASGAAPDTGAAISPAAQNASSLQFSAVEECQKNGAADQETFGVIKSQISKEIAEFRTDSMAIAAGVGGKVKSDLDQMNAALKTCSDSLDAASTGIKSCDTAAKVAGDICPESRSEILGQAVPAIGALLGVMSGSSVSDACKKQQNGLKIAAEALAAYNLACGGSLVMCKSKCKTASDGAGAAATKCGSVGQLASQVSTDIDQALTAALPLETCGGLTPDAIGKMKHIKLEWPEMGKSIQSNIQSIQVAHTNIVKCHQACEKFTGNLLSGGIGLMSTLASLKSSAQCVNKTTVTVNCTLAENQNNQQCICLRSPTSAGCSSATSPTAAQQSAVGTATTPGAAVGGGLGGAPTVAGGGLGGAPDSGAGGGPQGGGGGATPSGGTGANPATKGGAPASKEANYYGGGGGGGDGGGSRVGGAGGWADADAAGKGGAGGGRGLAGAGGKIIPPDVTGKAGKSNWDKVNSTYLQMSSNLIK